MKSAFDMAAQRHEAIVKEALLGALVRGAIAVGKKVIGTSTKASVGLAKKVVQNPGKSIGVAFGASEAQRGAKMLSKRV